MIHKDHDDYEEIPEGYDQWNDERQEALDHETDMMLSDPDFCTVHLSTRCGCEKKATNGFYGLPEVE